MLDKQVSMLATEKGNLVLNCERAVKCSTMEAVENQRIYDFLPDVKIPTQLTQ